MFRLLAIMLLLAGLTLGQSGYGGFTESGLASNGFALTAVHDESGARGQNEGHSGVPLHSCHLSSCSQTFLAMASLVSVRAPARYAVWPAVNEHNRSTIVDRDPPIPRSLI
jgi:hypothetical protein